MKNYYEMLEVSQKASKEVIEKAYKVLAKKYHPDLQEQEQKQSAEQKMKLINEAYEILSDDEKRKKYDIELKLEEERIKEIELKKRQQENLQNDNRKQNSVNNINRAGNTEENMTYQYEEEQPLTKEQMREQIKQERKAKREYQEEQERIYRNYMRSLGYKVKERWTLRKFIKLLQGLGIICVVILIIWFFPPTHKLLIQTYEENQIVKAIVDIFVNVVKGLGNGLATFFKSIFS